MYPICEGATYMHKTYTSLLRYAKALALCMVGIGCLLAAPAYALELSDIKYPLSRDEADRTLSKDYSYAMLEDGTIRRTWHLDDKRVFIDFNTSTNMAVMIAVIYNKPVAKNEAIEDAHTLAKGHCSETASWNTPRDKAAQTQLSNAYGLTNARRKQLSDKKGVLFYELADKSSKVSRVSLFALTPTGNRWVLKEVHPGDKGTAMGSHWGVGYVEDIYRNEALRQAKSQASGSAGSSAASADVPDAPAGHAVSADNGNTADVPRVTVTTTPAKPREADKPKTHTPPPAHGRTRTAMGTQYGGGGSSSTATPHHTPTTTTTLVKKSEGREGSREVVSTLPPAPTWLSVVGIAEPTWTHYIVLGIVALLMLMLLIRAISASKAQTARQKNFINVAGGASTPQPGERRRLK